MYWTFKEEGKGRVYEVVVGEAELKSRLVIKISSWVAYIGCRVFFPGEAVIVSGEVAFEILLRNLQLLSFQKIYTLLGFASNGRP